MGDSEAKNRRRVCVENRHWNTLRLAFGMMRTVTPTEQPNAGLEREILQTF